MIKAFHFKVLSRGILSRNPLALPGSAWIVVALASIPHLFCSNLYSLGLYIDDALYVILARALRVGRFDHAYLPFYAPEIHHLPGYPLVIAPVDWIFHDQFWGIRALSLLAVIMSAIALDLALKSSLPKGFRYFLLAAFLLNPTLIPISTAVMAEPLFMVATIWIVFLITREEQRGRGIGLGLLLGLACLLRPQGIFLLIAVVLWSLSAKKWKKLFPALAIALVIVIPVYARNLFVSSGISSYASLSIKNASALLNLPNLFAHLKAIWGTAFPEMIFKLPVPNSLVWRRFLAWGAIIFSFSLMGIAWRERKPPFLELGAVYVVISLLGLMAWPLVHSRFVLPLLPFILALLVSGAHELVKPLGRSKFPALAVFGFLLLGFNLSRDAALLKEAARIKKGSVSLLPEESFSWLKSNSRPEEVILSTHAPLVFLKSSRRSIQPFHFSSMEEFKSSLSKLSVRYAFLQPERNLLSVSNSSLPTEELRRLIREGSGAELVYQNESEGTEIYKFNWGGL